MSHWDLVQPTSSSYDFDDLDWQMEQVANRGGEVSLTLGLRQPHYPECHQPDWARKRKGAEWQEALFSFISTVVNRYKDRSVVTSWQLENESLNNDFGQCADFNEDRLERELRLVKQLDPTRPVIMSLKNHWSFHAPGPVPDMYATSIYLCIHHKGKLRDQMFPPWYQRLRAMYIRVRFNRPLFIHELQAEPWCPRGTQHTSIEEQDMSMNPERFKYAVSYALRTGIKPIDLWGLEWWYYRKQLFHDLAMWDEARKVFGSNVH
ncbi:MAG TPA: glycoside hydrolase family 2 TIM barrel-domain containing protein [Candidatus Polarisedimenticolaceae bacterium]|nr:glycoside hydrolase family 2 TIM barrel-domain containing protein [Candidatus Polarisedimenticolaceae bacterium]